MSLFLTREIHLVVVKMYAWDSGHQRHNILQHAASNVTLQFKPSWWMGGEWKVYELWPYLEIKKKLLNSISISQKSITCPYLILWQPEKWGLWLGSHYPAISLQSKNLCWIASHFFHCPISSRTISPLHYFFFSLGLMRKDGESLYKLLFQETWFLVSAFIWSFLNMQYVQQATKHEIYSVTQDNLY